MSPLYVVDIIGEVVEAVTGKVLATIQANETAAIGSTLIETIDYQYGHVNELIETLIQYDKAPDFQRKKYPLVYLAQDFPEDRGRVNNVQAEVTFTLYIVHHTDRNYKAMDRYTNVFKPVLNPIYDELLKQLWLHPWAMVQAPDLIQHRKWDRVFWGRKSVGGVDGNKLTDYVDAIELQDIKIKFSNKC